MYKYGNHLTLGVADVGLPSVPSVRFAISSSRAGYVRCSPNR